jgi:hypothetical protein
MNATIVEVLKISYNFCRNRHCPKCQCLDKERWLEARKRDLLPVRYFHVVFTLSDPLRPLLLRNQKVLYQILFRASSETLKELTQDPKHLGAEIGFIALLHTWFQTLTDHPHLHCIVTAGGLSPDGKRWIPCEEVFFLPVKVLARLFRMNFLAYLKKAYDKGQTSFLGKICSLERGNLTQSAFEHPLRAGVERVLQTLYPPAMLKASWSTWGDTPTGCPSPSSAWSRSKAIK